MANHIHDSQESNFEITSKRRKGFPSETRAKRGVRIVHGFKELSEKLGRNDPCPCGSGRNFQEVLPAFRSLRRRQPKSLFSASLSRRPPRAKRIGRAQTVAVRKDLCGPTNMGYHSK